MPIKRVAKNDDVLSKLQEEAETIDKKLNELVKRPSRRRVKLSRLREANKLELLGIESLRSNGNAVELFSKEGRVCIVTPHEGGRFTIFDDSNHMRLEYEGGILVYAEIGDLKISYSKKEPIILMFGEKTVVYEHIKGKYEPRITESGGIRELDDEEMKRYESAVRKAMDIRDRIDYLYSLVAALCNVTANDTTV